jgi:hypothetical protein
MLDHLGVKLTQRGHVWPDGNYSGSAQPQEALCCRAVSKPALSPVEADLS